MALKQKLTPDDYNVLEILEDPIWCAEFLRNTADGSPLKEEWFEGGFKHRDWQKDLLTDQNTYIVLTGGRAIGKCQPGETRVLTYPHGYMSMKTLYQECKDRGFMVYSLDSKGNIVTRPAFIKVDGRSVIYRLRTRSGYTTKATSNHPFLTKEGWEELKDLSIGDKIVVMRRLPHFSPEESLAWEELRWLGYVMSLPRFYVATFTIRYKQQQHELERIAAYANLRLHVLSNSVVRLERKIGSVENYPTTAILNKWMTQWDLRHGFRIIPKQVKSQSLESIRTVLEAYISMAGEFSSNRVDFYASWRLFLLDLQELLLRFGIKSTIEKIDLGIRDNMPGKWKLSITDYQSYYLLFSSFDIPGVKVNDLPERDIDTTRYIALEEIVEIEHLRSEIVYALEVPVTNNYIADHILSHNTVVLEDKLIYSAINADIEFPRTKESLIATANQNQITPLLDGIIRRFMNSALLSEFLRGQINKSRGTLDFTLPTGGNYRLNARIAGSRGENNMVGLHVPRITVDEGQLFPMEAFVQLEPTFNHWEPKTQQLFCGVPNGAREGNVLYLLDQKSPHFKKYRIPAHENPFFTMAYDIAVLKRYGGKDAEEYKHLVLGQHGEPAFSIIPRDKIQTESFDFYSYRFDQSMRQKGKNFSDALALPPVPGNLQQLVLAVDTGWTDPTVAQVMGMDKKGIWRTYARYRLTRIDFPHQAEIIDWLDNHFRFHTIAVDLGAGGGGIGLTQDLQSKRFPPHKQYTKRILGVRFSDFINYGSTADGIPMKTNAKSFAGEELARLITEGLLRFSELDFEGISQLERIGYTANADGTKQYFVRSDRGTAARSKDDHIFASYIVFIIALLNLNLNRSPTITLARPSWF